MVVVPRYLLPLPPCPRKVRVGANSPSRCPTISSVTNTFMCCLPLWTMNVCPTNSGTMTHARAQVLTGCFSPLSFCFSTLWKSLGSTKGPFFSDLPMVSRRQCRSCEGVLVLSDLQLSVADRAPPPDDHLVRGFVPVAGAAALGQLAGRADRVPPALGPAFAAAVGVVDGVHRRAADVRAPAEPSLAPRLAQLDVHVVGIAHRPDRRPASGRNPAA